MNLLPLVLIANLSTGAVLARQALPVAKRDVPAGTSLASASPAEPMYLTLSLVLRDHAGLEQLLADQQSPASAQYHRFLTPQQFGDRFGWGSDYDTLARSLREVGLSVTTYPNRLFIRTTGTVAQYEKLLGVHMYDARGGGLRFVTFQGTPTLAAPFAKMVQAVGGLDTRFRPHHLVTDTQGNATFGPDDLRAFYDMAPVHQSGLTGTHAKAAMLGTYPSSSNAYKKSDITTFYSQYSHASTQLVEDKVAPASSQDYDSQQGLDLEETMDAELPTVAAPGLASETMILVGASELFTTGIEHAVNNHPELNTISVSFGGCEQDAQQSDATAADDAFAQGAAEGQTWFLASGDDGVTGCARSSGSSAASSSFPSDSPHVISVGGTMYTGSFDSQGSVSAWGSEQTWNESFQGQTAAGGGGYSVYFSHPSWQTGPGTIASHGREQPDLALLANVQPGIALYVSNYGGFVGIGDGTSAAAPMAAGIFALVADQGGGCKFGLLNPSLYQLGSGSSGAFHDITQGSISANGTQGPAAGPGYDEATGWGSIDVAKMVGAFNQCSVVGGTTGSSGGTTTSGGPTGATSTSTGGTTGTGGTSGGNTGAECSSCQQDSDCGAGGYCIGGTCTSPCDSSGSCSDASSTCFQISDQSTGQVIGNGCYPSSQSCSGWTPSGTSGSGTGTGSSTTTTSSGGTTTTTTGSSGGPTTGSSGGPTSGTGSTTSSGGTTTTSGGPTSGATTGSSGTTGAPSVGEECHACVADSECGAGGFCLEGRCTAPCGENGTCADPTSSCYPLADANNNPLGNGCFPTSQSCDGFAGASSGGTGSGGTTASSPTTTGSTGTTATGTGPGTGGKTGGCSSAGVGDLAFALLALLPFIRRRRA